MNIEKKVKEILRELSGKESIGIEEHLQNDIGLDSLMMVTMLVEIEDIFDIELDETDMNPFDLSTVNSVVNMVSQYCGEKDE